MNMCVYFGIRIPVANDTERDIDDILHLVHILLAVGISEDKGLIRLLSDTLVGLGLTVSDGKEMVGEIVKEIAKGYET